MPLPSHRVLLCEELIPDLKETKGRIALKKLLVGVRGVALAFDLYGCQRKAEDNLSVAIYFIDMQWRWYY